MLMNRYWPAAQFGFLSHTQGTITGELKTKHVLLFSLSPKKELPQYTGSTAGSWNSTLKYKHLTGESTQKQKAFARCAANTETQL